MFDNISEKIKMLAKVVCWLGIIVCIITGIVLMTIDESLVLAGILTAVLGSLLSWVSSFVLYGFGQLVENSDILVESGRTTNAKLREQVNLTSVTKQVDVSYSDSLHKWRCDSCGKMISSSPCPYCGKSMNL